MGEGRLDIENCNVKVTCQKEGQMAIIFKLAAEKTTVLHPRSEVLITGKVIEDSSYLMQAIVEPL